MPKLRTSLRAQLGNKVWSTSYTYEETNDRLTTDTFITYAMQEAEKQSMQKFGTKIGPVIEDEFKDVILPKIEEAIAELASDVPEDSLQSLAISQNQLVEIMRRFFTSTIRNLEMICVPCKKIIHRKMVIILISITTVLMMDTLDIMS